MGSMKRRLRPASKRRRHRALCRERRRRRRIYPIRILLKHFVNALATIAPERADDLHAAINKYGIRFIIEETDAPFLFLAHPNRKTITAGTGSLGRLWASAYGYFCLYTTVATARKRDLEVRELNLKNSKRMAEASALLEWTVHSEMELAKAIKEKRPLPMILWPVGLPRPKDNPAFASDGHVADELFLCAGAFILHHELSHFRLGHWPTWDSDEMKQFEYEADEAAAEWILSGFDDQGDLRFVKRALGVALAMVWLSTVAVYVPEDHTYHPPSSDRLVRVLDRYITDPMNVVWAFISTGLRATLEAGNLPYDKTRETTSFKSDVAYCLDIFRKHQPAKK